MLTAEYGFDVIMMDDLTSEDKTMMCTIIKSNILRYIALDLFQLHLLMEKVDSSIQTIWQPFFQGCVSGHQT